jgi:hypothetical protein
VTANGACAALKETAKGVLRTAQGALTASRSTLDGANAVLEAAKAPITAAQGTLDLANTVLEGVKIAYQAGTQAVTFIAKFALTKILRITEMYFRVELSVANGGVFQCRVKGVLVGNSFDESFTFDTSDILGIARSLADKAAKGISNYI